MSGRAEAATVVDLISVPNLPSVRDVDGHGVPVPDTFSAEALAEAVATGDSALTEAANHAEDAAVTQYLAGVPDLLQRYELADQVQRAIVHAAMNARRLGHGEWLLSQWHDRLTRGLAADGSPETVAASDW